MSVPRSLVVFSLLGVVSAWAQTPSPSPALDLAGTPTLGMGADRRQTQLSASGDNLLEFLADRQDCQPFTGLRTYVQRLQGSDLVRYRERIRVASVGGAQRFCLELLQVEGLSVNALAIRRKLFENHAGFLYAYRDFRVHDVETARANYTVTPLGAFVKAGRTLRVFDVKPRQQLLSSYRIVVDTEGLVLDQAELDPGGRVVSALVYEAVEFGQPAMSEPIPWWEPAMDSRRHASLDEACQRLDFLPRVPKDAGQGFALAQVRTTKTSDDGKTYLIFVYNDGIDTRFVVESKAGNSLSFGLAKLDQPSVPVERFRLGPVTQFRVQSGGRECLVLGQFYGEGVPALLAGLVQ